MFIRVVHVCNIGVYIICIYIVIIYMYITVHTCINKCSWWVFDWHQPSQQWNCDTLYTTISWLYYNIYIYILVCVCDVSVCLGSLSLALNPSKATRLMCMLRRPLAGRSWFTPPCRTRYGDKFAKGTGSSRRMLDIFQVWCCMNLTYVDLIRVIHARNWECVFHVFFKIQPSITMYQVVQ